MAHDFCFRRRWWRVLTGGLSALWPMLVVCGQEARNEATESVAPGAWRELFDGARWTNWQGTNWQVTRFGGEGKVGVTDGVIGFDVGSPLTGIHWDGEPPMPGLNYELNVVARRVEGSDFFCGLTFPYQDSHCTLIVGGWGGALVGFSCLDGRDASENETTRLIQFEQGRWYDVLIKVQPNRMEAWIDGQRRIECVVNDRQVDTRIEVSLSKPLGIASYSTRAEVKSIRWRPLPSDD